MKKILIRYAAILTSTVILLAGCGEAQGGDQNVPIFNVTDNNSNENEGTHANLGDFDDAFSANLDIAESELGENEWLDDIRTEGQRMGELVNQLVALSRMDEEKHQIACCDLSLSDIVSDTVSEFVTLADERGKKLSSDVGEGIVCRGDEALIRRLLSVLLDNAVKYCDEGGEIKVCLKRRRYIELTVENTYKNVESLELDKLFDRFYRADKARTYTGGFGIGLSIAKAIAQKHRGEISAYKKDGSTIGFAVVMK
jgi:signal transduction histidine kinase